MGFAESKEFISERRCAVREEGSVSLFAKHLRATSAAYIGNRAHLRMGIKARPELAGQPMQKWKSTKDGHVHWLDKGMCNIRESD
jgi:hypothetical protein